MSGGCQKNLLILKGLKNWFEVNGGSCEADEMGEDYAYSCYGSGFASVLISEWGNVHATDSSYKGCSIEDDMQYSYCY